MFEKISIMLGIGGNKPTPKDDGGINNESRRELTVQSLDFSGSSDGGKFDHIQDLESLSLPGTKYLEAVFTKENSAKDFSEKLRESGVCNKAPGVILEQKKEKMPDGKFQEKAIYIVIIPVANYDKLLRVGLKNKIEEALDKELPADFNDLKVTSVTGASSAFNATMSDGISDLCEFGLSSDRKFLKAVFTKNASAQNFSEDLQKNEVSKTRPNVRTGQKEIINRWKTDIDKGNKNSYYKTVYVVEIEVSCYPALLKSKLKDKIEKDLRELPESVDKLEKTDILEQTDMKYFSNESGVFSTPSTSKEAPKSATEISGLIAFCLGDSYKEVYEGREQLYLHAVFENKTSAENFSRRLYENKLVQKAPCVYSSNNEENKKNGRETNINPKYKGTGCYFMRIHHSAFDNIRESQVGRDIEATLQITLPLEAQNLKKFSENSTSNTTSSNTPGKVCFHK